MITGWGANSRLREVHYFREPDGFPLCATNSKRRSQATLPLPHWDQNKPNTCPRCRIFLQKIEQKAGVTG